MLIIVSIVISIAQLMLRAFVIKMLWLWFILAQFPMLAPLSYGSAMGLVLFVSAITYYVHYSPSQIQEIKNMDSNEIIGTSVVNFLTQSMLLIWVLVFSWGIHKFM